MRRFAEMTFGIAFVVLLLVSCSLADGRGTLFWQDDGVRLEPNGVLTSVVVDFQADFIRIEDARCAISSPSTGYTCALGTLREPTSIVVDAGQNVTVCASFLRRERPKLVCLGDN